MKIGFFLIIFTLICWPRTSFFATQTVYLKPEEALKLFYPTSTFLKESKTLTDNQKVLLQKKLGQKLVKTIWDFTIARSGTKIDGYALMDSEVGKTEPITFMTAILPSGKVKAVEILVYREAYGSEVSQKGFLKQFVSKHFQEPLKLGDDITNITGATLSSRAVTRGVRRALFLWNTFYADSQ